MVIDMARPGFGDRPQPALAVEGDGAAGPVGDHAAAEHQGANDKANLPEQDPLLHAVEHDRAPCGKKCEP